MENINLISVDEYQTSERFYALPKILFESDLYKEMRLEAKVFYAVLKDRLSLSFKNNWIDEDGYVFLVYSNSKLMDILNCSKSTLLRMKKELTQFGLIYDVQQSTTKTGNLENRIYLGQLKDNFLTQNNKKVEDSHVESRVVSNLYQEDVKITRG